MATDTTEIQYKKEVDVRVKSFGTRCMDPQKPKTIKNEKREEVQREISHPIA